MKCKKSMIILMILTVFLFGIACACAGDVNDTAVACDDSMPIESVQDNNLNSDENNEILTDNPKTFTQLESDINESPSTFDVGYDYTFSNESDKGPVVIDKSDFTINGNNHVLDGNGQSGIFNITGKNVTINNLIFKNGKTAREGIVDSTGEITLNNVTFIMNNVTYINDHITYLGGAVANHGGKITCIDSRFIDNHAESGSAILIEDGELYVKNTYFTSSVPNKYGQIWARSSQVEIDNAQFINLSSIYSPAISLEYSNMRLTNSKFINLTADMSAGAIGLKRYGNLYIKGCEFKNTRSFKNAGAVNVDYIDFGNDSMNVTMLDTTFDNSYSMIGGAYIQLGGRLVMSNTNFTNNRATYYGGAVYLSFTESRISNCTFDSNAVELVENYTTSGGAIFSDYNNLTITNSRFTNNSATEGNAIYACDTSYNITGCTFRDNKNALYSYFDKNPCSLDNNVYGNDTLITNETLSYATYVDSPALKFEPITNTINVTGIPSRFDLRDWGWVTPVKSQGHMGACWTFGTIASLESALLKTYGMEFDLSEGNLHHNMMKYFKYGCIISDEGGTSPLGDSYLIGWYGPELETEDVYDEVGKLSPFKTSGYDTIHVQDVIVIANDDIGVGSKIKSAIMKYGALAVVYFADVTGAGYYDYEHSSQYTNESLESNHEVCVIGWDDSYSKDNFLITPPGDGAWIIKNSWGTQFGDNGILYISYYDKSFSHGDNQVFGMILENNIPYNKNYQHDFTWMGNFISLHDLTGSNGNITYANQFESAADDLIAAVGTYFNAGEINYTVKIYVNDELKLTQEGVSPYNGYHTIKLNQYIPVRKGDVFKAVVTSNAMPVVYCEQSRVHFSENMSFVWYGGEWEDLLSARVIACLKVYTVNDTSAVVNNNDISVDYGAGKYFTVNVKTDDGHAVSGAVVKFDIGGRTTIAFTDGEGIAKVEITDVPGTYEVTTTYNNQTYKNGVAVKLNPSTCKITENKDIAVDYDGGKYFSVKIVSADGKVAASGVSVKFTINGKSTTVTTDADGIAKIKITDVPKKYAIETAFDGKSVKNTVTVKQVLKAKKVTVKKTAKKFALKATLKINGKAVKGKTITFKFNGKTYKVKTNKKGVAQKTLNRKVIKKLKKGRTYAVKVTYLKDTIKTTVKVK